MVIVPVSVAQATSLVPGIEPPRWVSAATEWVGQYRIANRYHVFPKIETERIEVQIEGSMDGDTWKPYAFRRWPGALDRAPAISIPHQPRIDWMLWFVPISPFFLDWLERFAERLLEGSPPVLARLRGPLPFDGAAPRMLRLKVYRYRFTTPEERAATGDWWRRDYLGPFYPLPSLSR